MLLTNDNYFGKEMDMKYLSVSQFKNFAGAPFKEGCEFRALAELKGEYEREPSVALLVGSYTDCLLTEPHLLEKFENENKDIFKYKKPENGLKKDFLVAKQMASRVKQDKKFMAYMDGEHQKIYTGTLFGVEWKIEPDTINFEKGFISDLKTCESIRKGYWTPDGRMNFIEYFDYVLQAAIYQEIVFQNTGKRLPFYICAISKEEDTDFEVIYLDNETLHDRIYGNEFQEGIANQVNAIRIVKNGEVEPCRCGSCSWCRKHKSIKKPIHFTELLGEIN